jgi:hypothetical protein
MSHIPPTQTSPKHGPTSLLLVLLAYALQVFYLPAHLALEDHHSVWDHYVVAAENSENPPHQHQHQHQHHPDCSHGANFGAGVAGKSEIEHDHGDDHEHGCEIFVQRQSSIQKRIFDTDALPAESPVTAVCSWTFNGKAIGLEEFQLRTLPQLALGSRGPPVVV